MLCMYTSPCARANDVEIMCSKDAQCNLVESPKTSFNSELTSLISTKLGQVTFLLS